MNTELCVGHECGAGGTRSARTAAPGLRLCAECAARVEAELAQLPRIHAACEHALISRRSAVALRIGRGRRAAGISLNEDALSARSCILACLSSWASLVIDERGLTGVGRRHPGELAAFLRTNLAWLLMHPAAGDFAAEIAEPTAETRRSLHGRNGRRRDLGECVQPGCTAALTAAPAHQNGANATAEIRCAAGHSWQPHQWLQLSRQLQRERHRTSTTG